MPKAFVLANKLPEVSGQASGKPLELCADPSSDKFVRHVLGIRDQAVRLAQGRKAELMLWNARAKQRTKEWFGTDDNEIRGYLLKGLDATIRVLQGGSAKSFLKHSSESAQLTGCAPEIGADAKAAVCQIDTTEHRIMIALGFCDLPEDKKSFGTESIRHGDSQLLTLVHEVTHFNDVFGSKDHWYGTRSAQGYASDPRSKLTADNLAAYIVGVTDE